MSRMFNISMALLNCAEYNEEKLEAHGWIPQKSMEEAVCRKLELGLCKIILILNYSEKQFWGESVCEGISKKLREELSRLLNNTLRERTEKEYLAELSKGIGNGISYLQGIKGTVNAKTFQHIEKHLRELQQIAQEKILAVN